MAVKDIESYVYYILSNGEIKIGVTKNLNQRMKTLRPKLLLALEKGDPLLEHKRHLQFSDYLIDTEWFEPGPKLLAHIENLREEFPPTEWPNVNEKWLLSFGGEWK